MKTFQKLLKTVAVEEQSVANEGVGSFLKKSALIALLTIPGILEADDIEKLPDLTPVAISKLADENNEKTYGGYSKAKAANIIARTLYAEAANQPDDGKLAVASVIWNRANHNPQNLVKVCFAKLQFSCWNEVNPSTNSKYSPKNYSIKIPQKATKDKKSKDAWNYCKEIASTLIYGNFKSTIGNCNAYYNPSKVSPKWAKYMTNIQMIGNHKFGYLTDQDPANKKVVSKNIIHIVKKGETLLTIAKKYGIDWNKIKDLNKIKDPNKISIGQKLKIPND